MTNQQGAPEAPKSTALDGKTELFHVPGHPLLVRAVDFNRLYAENAALQQGYDAARLEIDHLRGVTKSTLLAQPVAWMVYLPSIDTQHLYYSQEDMGYVDDVTNHADAEVTPLYEMAAPKAEVAPAGEYPPLPTGSAWCGDDDVRDFGAGAGESALMFEPTQTQQVPLFTAGQMRAYVDADRAARATADSVTAPASGATGKNLLQVQAWVIPDGNGGGQFSWQKQDERYWTRLTPPAQTADSVLEDAARYRFLAGHCRSTSEHWGGRWSIIVDGPAPKSHDSEDDFDEAVDAARKQGANHD